jgi:2-C-methyl-D-erythritol 4-phosphate cytidylyltransferase
MLYWLVMPAAGVGRRFGEHLPKQYAPLHGRTVIEWALAPFLTDSRCAGAVVVLAAGDPHWGKVAERLPRLMVATGGAERSQSVRNGLAALDGHAAAEDWVLVHDAARPCLFSQDLECLLERVGSHPIGGLLAAPAADTLKRVSAGMASSGMAIEQTVDRAGLWRALTPQMFRYRRLCEALDSAVAAGRLPTDEAQALEWLGERPILVEGSAANIKITSADDLLVAAALLGARADSLAPGQGSPQ